MNRLLLPLACNKGGRWFAGAGGQLQSHHFILLKLKLFIGIFFSEKHHQDFILLK
jgi:hypothetical protein